MRYHRTRRRCVAGPPKIKDARPTKKSGNLTSSRTSDDRREREQARKRKAQTTRTRTSILPPQPPVGALRHMHVYFQAVWEGRSKETRAVSGIRRPAAEGGRTSSTSTLRCLRRRFFGCCCRRRSGWSSRAVLTVDKSNNGCSCGIVSFCYFEW